MLPYNDKAKCPKCGDDDIATNWIAERPSSTGPTEPENMRRTCANCNYIWKEAPLDAV